MMRSISDLTKDHAALVAYAKSVADAQPAAVDAFERAKLAAVAAVRAHVAFGLTADLTKAIADVAEAHETIHAERAPDNEAVWDELLEFATAERLADLRKIIGDDVPAEKLTAEVITDPARRQRAAEELAEMAAETLCKPPPSERGKWLARHGIVSSDLEAVLSAMNGRAAAAAEPPPPPVVEASPEELAEAFALFYSAARSDAEEYAKRLNVSRNTYVNWCTGRTRPKCSAETARALIADIDRRMADLGKAAEIFARVRR